MEQIPIYLCYRTDRWLSTDSKRLIYTGEDIEDCIAQLEAYEGMTKEQAKQVREDGQSQCTGAEYEWIVEKQYLNTFTY
jgi:hypothetical protein